VGFYSAGVIGVWKGVISRPESEIPYWFLSQFESHRSPPVSFLGTGNTVLSVFHLSARRRGKREYQECSTLSITPAQGPWTSTFSTFLINNTRDAHPDAQQRSDARRDDPPAHMTVLHGVLPRVTLRLSDLSVLYTRKSGVVCASSLPSHLTGLKTLRREEASTQGISSSLSPGPHRHTPGSHWCSGTEDGGESSVHRCTQGCIASLYTQG